MPKVVNVIYKVDDKELQAVKDHLKTVENQTKQSEAEMVKLGKTANDAGKAGATSFLNFSNVIGAISFTTILAGLTALGKKIFELGTQQEQLNIAFTTFLGSAERAKKLIADLTKFSIVTPFTPDQVNKAAKSLLAFGVQADDIIPTLKMIGDVSAGTGKDLSEMAIIFGQIRSTGRLMGQDLLQLINAGFNPLQVISEQTGKSVRDLKSDMEKGLITFDMVSNAFKTATSEGGLFFDLMAKQSETVAGKLSTISGNLDEMGKALYATSSGPVAFFVGKLADMSDRLLKLTTTDQLGFFEKLAAVFALSLPGGAAYVDQINKITDKIKETADAEKEKQITSTVNAALASGNIEAYIKALDTNIYKEEIIARIRKKQKDDTIEQKGLIDELIEKINKLESDKKSATSKGRIAQINQDLAELKKQLQGLQNLGLGSKDVDPFVKIGEESKAGIDVVTDNAEKKIGDVSKDLESLSKQIFAQIKSEYDAEQKAAMDSADQRLKIEDDHAKKVKQIRQGLFDFALNAASMLFFSSMNNNNAEQQALQDKYDRELELAGNNEKAKKDIQARQKREQEALNKKQAQDDKQRRITTILGESLINAVKALGLPPIPGANYFAAAQAIAFGGLQAAIAGRYKDGGWIEGPGTTTSDSIPILASRDEFMVKASAASASRNLLEAINNREIDDSILTQAAKAGGAQVNVFDDSRLIQEMRANRVDYAAQGYTLMEVQRKGSNFKRYIRSKVQGY